MRQRTRTAEPLRELLALAGPAPDAALPPGGGWLSEELKARDAATTDALLEAVRAHSATAAAADPARHAGWLAAELERRDEDTTDVLRRGIQERFARIERITS